MRWPTLRPSTTIAPAMESTDQAARATDEIERHTFLLAMAATFLAVPLAAHAQPPGKIWRIGVLGLRSAAQALLQGLRELGYMEGKNITAERQANRAAERADSRAVPHGRLVERG